MASLNQLQIIGNVGKAPELRYLASGDPVCAVSIATNEKHKDKAGNPVEHTEWHRVVLFGRQAEIAAEYLAAGSQVFIQGRLRSRDYTDKNGEVRRIVEVISDKLVLLGRADKQHVGGDSGRLDNHRRRSAMQADNPLADLVDDVPF